MELVIDRLGSGGLMVNYRCPSQCGHCLYACGPGRPRDYIQPDAAQTYFKTIRRLGCSGVHVGGGEPFLNPAGLEKVLETATKAGVRVQYVETNSAWFKDLGQAVEILASLKQRGLDTLLISLSPFHNEFIPFARVKGVVKACAEAGIKVFPWIEEFWPELEALGDSRPHRLAEFKARFGPDYLRDLPGRYWVHMGGRAVVTFAQELPLRPLSDLEPQCGPCRELVDTSHFHIDLYGSYVPGLCAGLAFDQALLGGPVPREDHPVLTRLFESGPWGLLDWAQGRAGFSPKKAYLNKCHLCLDIRAHLFRRGQVTPDLAPAGFYESLPEP